MSTKCTLFYDSKGDWHLWKEAHSLEIGLEIKGRRITLPKSLQKTIKNLCYLYGNISNTMSLSDELNNFMKGNFKKTVRRKK